MDLVLEGVSPAREFFIADTKLIFWEIEVLGIATSIPHTKHGYAAGVLCVRRDDLLNVYINRKWVGYKRETRTDRDCLFIRDFSCESNSFGLIGLNPIPLTEVYLNICFILERITPSREFFIADTKLIFWEIEVLGIATSIPST